MDKLNSSSGINSSKESSCIDACFFSPLSYVKRFAINGNHVVSSGIVSLLPPACPATVFRRIITIVINAINTGFVIRSFPHINIEVFKRVKPSITNFNTPPTISSVGLISRIIAALFKMHPALKFYRAGFAMNFTSRRCRFTFKAPARFSVTRTNVVTLNDFSIPAITQTQPSYFLKTFGCKYIGSTRDNSKTVEFLTCQVYKLRSHFNFLSEIAQKIGMWQTVLSTVVQVSPSHKLSIA